MKSTQRLSRRAALMAAVILSAIMAARVVSTYPIFSQTFDEPFHIACGMEWLDQGSYHYEALHPPLARIASALGPYLAGGHSEGYASPIVEGNAILANGSRYTRVLGLARLGELPFVLLACAGVWVLALHVFGRRVAVCSVFLFTMLPPVLAHGGLATTDIAITGTFIWAVYAYIRWLEARDLKSTVFLGFWTGMSLASKASAIPFLGLTFGTLSIAYLFSIGFKNPSSIPRVKQLAARAVPALLIAFLVLWACYRFTVRPLFTPGELAARPGDFPRRMINAGFVHDLVTKLPVPAPEYARGLGQAWRHNNPYMTSYLLGEHGKNGWWYFFPVVLGLKTPLGFLVLAVPGVAALLWRLGLRDWKSAAPALCATAILAVCMLSRINMGVRHILPIYSFLSVGAGYFAVQCMNSDRRIRATLASVGLLWCCASSVKAHPDYLAYFNEIASRHPERYLLDSDLDWGQDLNRLSKRLAALHAPSVRIAYFGSADLSRSGLPPTSSVCDGLLQGHVAVSVTFLYPAELGKCPERFAELGSIEPRERVGKSIFLYYFPAQ